MTIEASVNSYEANSKLRVHSDALFPGAEGALLLLLLLDAAFANCRCDYDPKLPSSISGLLQLQEEVKQLQDLMEEEMWT